MAKSLTIKDLQLGRKAAGMEDEAEGVGMRSIAEAVTPSLAPIAQSLGKLQQISDPRITEGASVKSADISLSKGIKEASDSLKTLVQLNRTLNRTMDKINQTLVDQLNFSKQVDKRLSKQDEENNELFRRMMEVTTTDIAAGPKKLTDQTTQATVSEAGTSTGAVDEQGKTKPGSRLGRAAKIAVGAAVGGAAGGALYGIAPQELRDLLGSIGIGEKAAATIGAAIGGAIAADLPWKQMISAAGSVVTSLTSLGLEAAALGLKFVPLIAAVGAVGYGLYKLDEYLKGLTEEERQSAAKSADMLGALDPATAAQKIEEAVTSEEGKKAALTREQQAATITRMGGSVWRALDMGGMLGGGTAADFVRKEEEMVESSRARGLAGAGREITLPTQPQFITPYTEEISSERAQEIFRGTPPLWKKMTPEKRSEFLIAARSRGVMDINPDLTRATNTGFVSGSMRASEAEVPSVTPSTTAPALSSRLGMFNTSTTQQSLYANVPPPPTIIRGGDTINNVNNVSGGGGGGGASGSPSMPSSPWETTLIGRRMAPYQSGFGG